MTQTPTVIDKRVLVCDDEEFVFTRLLERFERSNSMPASGDAALAPPSPKLRFHLTWAGTIAEAAERLKGQTAWDVIVIDRKFKEAAPDGSLFWSQHILRALNDLRSEAVRIVFTAHPDSRDVVECMRLGAWDYLYKNEPKERMGSPYQDVVNSAVKGLLNKISQERRNALSQQAMSWIRANRGKLMEEFHGRFVPLRKRHDAPPADQWEIVRQAAAPSLFQTYDALHQMNLCAEQIHIVWVEAPQA